MRAELLLLAALAAAPAGAHDAGHSVTFKSVEGVRFSVRSSGASGPRVIFESADSDPVPEEWDTVLVQGVLPDPGVNLQVLKAGATDWETLSVHRFPGGRFWAKARTARAPGALRLRALDAGVRRSHEVEVFGIEVFVDQPQVPGGAPLPPRGPEDPSAPRPFVHARAEWGAVQPTEPYSPDPLVWRITLHHSDGRHTETLAESLDEAKFIQDFHQHGRGWIDIGYHFIVDPSGNILEARPEGVLGAHTLANNEGNIGIVLLGTYHPPKNDRPTQTQLEALVALGRYLVKRHGIDPESLKGHRDYKKTDCPGNKSYVAIADLRKAFAGGPVPVPPAKKRRTAKAPALISAAPDWDGAQRAQ
ncbi:MAG: hypothetical protein A2V88_14935 [Elusimicrobia bacterium RBG_16_66_12]|nr:MAG: hypothetical protein A2V88_14935 [Elusimicrobia bacterium RBG_16_66_12]